MYTGIDTSYLPGTTHYVQSGVGKVHGTISTTIDFSPDNTVMWANVPNFTSQKLETYIYGKDRLRPDSRLGHIKLALKKIDQDCVPVPLFDQKVDSDIFTRR